MKKALLGLGLALMMPLMMMASDPPAGDMPEWGNWKTFTTKDGLPANKIYAVRADGDRVWIGTSHGLVLYENNEFTTFTTEDGLAQDESAWLLQLRQLEGAYRTNISVTNTGDSSASVAITLFADDGTQIGHYTRSIAPSRVFQDIQPIDNRANRPNLGWGFAKVEVLQGNGVLTSASVIDAVTNDATTVPAWR